MNSGLFFEKFTNWVGIEFTGCVIIGVRIFRSLFPTVLHLLRYIRMLWLLLYKVICEWFALDGHQQCNKPSKLMNMVMVFVLYICIHTHRILQKLITSLSVDTRLRINAYCSCEESSRLAIGL